MSWQRFVNYKVIFLTSILIIIHIFFWENNKKIYFYLKYIYIYIYILKSSQKNDSQNLSVKLETRFYFKLFIVYF